MDRDARRLREHRVDRVAALDDPVLLLRVTEPAAAGRVGKVIARGQDDGDRERANERPAGTEIHSRTRREATAVAHIVWIDHARETRRPTHALHRQVRARFMYRPVAQTITIATSAVIQMNWRVSGLPSIANPTSRAAPMPAIAHMSRPAIGRHLRREVRHPRDEGASNPASVPPQLARRLIRARRRVVRLAERVGDHHR